MDKIIKENQVIDFGVLGKYRITEKDYVNSKFGVKENFFTFLTEIMEEYDKKIAWINNAIVYKIYNAIWFSAYRIWEHDGFKKIIDEDKLPSKFYEFDNKTKNKLVYKEFDYDPRLMIRQLKVNVPFLNVSKFKKDITIKGLSVDREWKKIQIRFDGLCDFFKDAVIKVKCEYKGCVVDLVCYEEKEDLSKYEVVKKTSSCCRVVKRGDNHYGVVSPNEEIVLQFEYDEVKTDKENDGYVIVRKDKKWGAFDINGNEILPIEYDNIWLKKGEYFLVYKWRNGYRIIHS